MKMLIEELINFLRPLFSKFHTFYLVVAAIIIGGCYILQCPRVKEFLYGPEWNYMQDKETEAEFFWTDTKLKSGKITVEILLEFKYEGKVFYTLEVQGVYNINQVALSSYKIGYGDDEGQQKSAFCLIIENKQRDDLDSLIKDLKELVGEYLQKKSHDVFKIEEFEIHERQIAEIYYQSATMNRSRPMYITVSKEEVRTITKREADKRGSDTSLNLDKFNLEKSFHTDEKILEIMEGCAEKILK